MESKTVFHYLRTGSIQRLEQTLCAMSKAGWQPERLGRLRQRYVRSDTVYRYLLGYCAGTPGTASYITYTAAQERLGWRLYRQRRGWLLFRKGEEEAQPDAALDRGDLAALFGKRSKRRETARIWLILLAAVLMIGGYLTDILPLIYAFAAPMLAALLLTYQIKFMQDALSG